MRWNPYERELRDRLRSNRVIGMTGTVDEGSSVDSDSSYDLHSGPSDDGILADPDLSAADAHWGR